MAILDLISQVHLPASVNMLPKYLEEGIRNIESKTRGGNMSVQTHIHDGATNDLLVIWLKMLQHLKLSAI